MCVLYLSVSYAYYYFLKFLFWILILCQAHCQDRAMYELVSFSQQFYELHNNFPFADDNIEP